MRKLGNHGRIALIALLLASVAILQGCNYAAQRWDDAIDMFDVGLTFSKTPQFSAYLNCPTVIPIGWGKVDGYFWGMADGKTGMMRHKREEKGLLFWGKEQMTFNDFDAAEDTERIVVEDVGLVGLAAKTRTAKKRPMCIHHLHLGWVGLVGNIRYQEIGDFALGLVGIDYMQDDGPNGGWWFKRKQKVPTVTVTADATANEAPRANTAHTHQPLAEIGLAKILPVERPSL